MRCPHSIQHTVEDEVVCAKCGTVIGYDAEQDTALGSQLKLYHMVEPGSKTPKRNSFVHDRKAESSYFSNACDKLALPKFASLEAWQNYCKIIKNVKSSRAEAACFALFVVCRRYSIPRKDEEIRDAVRIGLCVKRAPTILRSFSRLKNKAEQLGIDCNGHSADYYLNLYLSKAQHYLPDQLSFNKVKQRARNLFSSLNGNVESRARRAVELALGRRNGWKK